jgi:hypothetical protein
MSAKTPYVIRLSEDLYLDSNNNFLTGALPNVPIYALAGGDLPLSDNTRKALFRQILAMLPRDDPRWKAILRSIGIGARLTEEVLHQTHRDRFIDETVKACVESAGRRVTGPPERLLTQESAVSG